MAKEEISAEDWARYRSHPFADVNTPADWPSDVKPISIDGAILLGIGPGNKLYFDGKELEFRRTLKLEWWQTLLAAIAAFGAGISGLIDWLNYAAAFQ